MPKAPRKADKPKTTRRKPAARAAPDPAAPAEPPVAPPAPTQEPVAAEAEESPAPFFSFGRRAHPAPETVPEADLVDAGPEAQSIARPLVQGEPAPATAVLVEPVPEPAPRHASRGHAPRAQAAEADQQAPAPPLQVGARRQLRMSLTAEFLTLAVSDPWQSRFEKLKPGTFGGALIAAPLLELVLNGRLRVQRDHFQVVDGPALPLALEELAQAVAEVSDMPSLDAMRRLGKKLLPDLLDPWKLRLAEAGVLALDSKNRIVQVADPDAQGALENRLMRVLAGSGVVQAQDTLLLGLAQMARLLPRFVPQSALAFNEKRIRNLLAGRDTMDYRVDAALRGLQEVAVSTILGNVGPLMGN